jgi:hypothetical protein
LALLSILPSYKEAVSIPSEMGRSSNASGLGDVISSFLSDTHHNLVH